MADEKSDLGPTPPAENTKMLQISVENQGQRFTTIHDSGPLEFGRSATPSPDHPDARRIQLDDAFTSRHHLRIEPVAEHELLLDNLSSVQPVILHDGRILEPGSQLQVDFGRVVTFSLGKTRVDLETRETADHFQTIARPSVIESKPVIAGQLSDAPAAETVANWFETLTEIQRAAAGTDDFYNKAAQAMVRLIGFDQGSVLLRENDRWIVKATVSAQKRSENEFSHTLLEQVLNERRTFFEGQEEAGSTASLIRCSLAAASPIYEGATDNVKGAVYGARFGIGPSGSKAITPVEARLLQCLAGVVSVGTARAEHQEKAIRRRAQLSQFFTETLAEELERDPQLMEGREREISVLFADMRQFSNVSSKLTPRETCNLIGDVMECLTEVVRQQDGVLVDYVGDGLLAIWNAPTDLPEHARKASAAAVHMQLAVQSVDEDWRDRIHGNIRLGVGVNTGVALVGNTGTKYKIKYGPLGHTVNLASRVEGATKHFGVPVLITGATQKQLDDSFMTRRLCEARMVGIETPVELFELQEFDPSPEWLAMREAYEEGLRLFEQQSWSECCQNLMPMLGALGESDPPSLMLMRRALDCLTEPPAEFDSVVSLTQK